jgi:hypothetical protein
MELEGNRLALKGFLHVYTLPAGDRGFIGFLVEFSARLRHGGG